MERKRPLRARVFRYSRHMLVGYARVSTADQNPDHHIDALTRAGVALADIYVDRASGANASRHELEKALASANRRGDQLVITRFGRSVLHFVALGATFQERGVGLQMLAQGIDTTTAEGRAMFGMLSVLAELQRELTIADTRDGLAAARARVRKGGRPPKPTPEQAVHAQERYDAGSHTVQQIADLLKTPRPTIYGHLNKEKASAENRNPPNNPADFLGRSCSTTTPCPIVRIYLAFLILDATVQCLG